jgi:hypothetical protein
MRLQPRKGPIPVGTHEPAITDHIDCENGGQLAFDAFRGQSGLHRTRRMAHRGKLDTWLTDALKATVKAYIRVRYGINLGSLTAVEEKEYWHEFGLRLQAFLALAEPIAIEMYGRSFVSLTQSEQAEVIRRVARDKNEDPA